MDMIERRGAAAFLAAQVHQRGGANAEGVCAAGCAAVERVERLERVQRACVPLTGGVDQVGREARKIAQGPLGLRPGCTAKRIGRRGLGRSGPGENPQIEKGVALFER
jgi:hypothetical protein